MAIICWFSRTAASKSPAHELPYLLTSERVFNPAFFEEVGWVAEPAGNGTLVLVTSVVVGLIATRVSSTGSTGQASEGKVRHRPRRLRPSLWLAQ